MNNNFIRNIRIQVVAMASNPYTFDNEIISISSKESFKIRFEVLKKITSDSNTAIIQIYNLSKEKRLLLSSNPKIWINLYAGYPDNESLLYAGELTNSSNVRNGADIVTTLNCRTDWDLDREFVIGSFASNSTVMSVIYDVLNKAKIPYSKENIILSGVQGERITTQSGSVSAILNKLAQNYNFNWSLQDYGFLALSDDKALKNEQEITSPLVDFYQMSKEKDRTSSGFDVTCHLDGKFNVGNIVSVNSQINGSASFKIHTLKHKGDTSDSRFVTSIKGFELGSLKIKPVQRREFAVSN